jgi:hypothetical protein
VIDAPPVGSPARAGAQLRVGWGVGTVVGGDADDAAVLHPRLQDAVAAAVVRAAAGHDRDAAARVGSGFSRSECRRFGGICALCAGPPQPSADDGRTSADRGAPAKKRSPGDAALERWIQPRGVVAHRERGDCERPRGVLSNAVPEAVPASRSRSTSARGYDAIQVVNPDGRVDDHHGATRDRSPRARGRQGGVQARRASAEVVARACPCMRPALERP